MPQRGDLVTIVNRTNFPLDVMKNGVVLVLKPGNNVNIDFEWVRYAKNQHPVMGTESPYGWGTADLKVGVLGTKDDVYKLDAEYAKGKDEFLDRSQMEPADVQQIGGRMNRTAVQGQSATHHTTSPAENG